MTITKAYADWLINNNSQKNGNQKKVLTVPKKTGDETYNAMTHNDSLYTYVDRSSCTDRDRLIHDCITSNSRVVHPIIGDGKI